VFPPPRVFWLTSPETDQTTQPAGPRGVAPVRFTTRRTPHGARPSKAVPQIPFSDAVKVLRGRPRLTANSTDSAMPLHWTIAWLAMFWQ
jgi:hypothetical protein